MERLVRSINIHTQDSSTGMCCSARWRRRTSLEDRPMIWYINKACTHGRTSSVLVLEESPGKPCDTSFVTRSSMMRLMMGLFAGLLCRYVDREVYASWMGVGKQVRYRWR
jgi:hypothetical protein